MRWALLCKRLSRKEVPFLVTLFAACAGWAINHVVDRVLDSPTIVYKTDIVAASNGKIVKVTMTNLSKQAFFGLKFEIQAPGIRICDTPPKYEPPAWPSNKPPAQGTDGVAFIIDQLHPSWEMSMCAKLNGDKTPVFLLRETGSSSSQGESSKQAVRLVKPSLETFFVRHNLILMGLLALASLIAFIYWLLRSEDVK